MSGTHDATLVDLDEPTLAVLERIAVALEQISGVLQASTGYPASYEQTIDDMTVVGDDTMERMANPDAWAERDDHAF